MQTTPPPRANDPETHEPYERRGILAKLASWAWMKWGRKLNLKIAVMAAPIIGMIAASLGHTPDAQQAIGIGLSAMLLGVLDIAISYATHRLHLPDLESTQKISEQEQQDVSAIDWGKIFSGPPISPEPRFKPLNMVGWPKKDDVPEVKETEEKPLPPVATSRFGFSVDYTAQGRQFSDTFGTLAEAIVFRDDIRQREGHMSAKIITP